MPSRLNHKAYKIIAAEITRAAAEDVLAGEVSQKIALSRLNRLRSQQGNRITEKELKDLFSDILPGFNQKVCQKAAKANRFPSPFWIVPKIAIALTGMAGIIWILNLPYPMIRRPVARTAPILLLPSYWSMDRNYRQAIAKVEQADQLVNRTTSLTDLELGQEKVIQAQKHLDALPVWFLGYEPKMYRTFFSFSWKFTLDEFRAARASIGRMDAKIFQEKNAMAELTQAETEIKQAKQNYQQAQDTTTKQTAIAHWQAGIDKLAQLPPRTLAGEKASRKLKAYLRDFQQVSGLVAGNNRTNTIISVAQQFFARANDSCNNPPHSSMRWEKCATLLKKAIARLERVPLEDAGYLKAQTMLATYETKLGEIELRISTEKNSLRAFETAKSEIITLPKSIDAYNRDRTIREIQTIIYQLEKVQDGTTVYQESQYLLESAKKKLRQIDT